MSEGTRYAPDDYVFSLYGRAVFGVQAIERSMRVAVAESISYLDKLTPKKKSALRNATLGNLIGMLDRLIAPRFKEEFGDLTNYCANRNYLAHHFFIDFVDPVADEARHNKAERFLRFCESDAVLAINRIEFITRELQLPHHIAYTERRDLELLEKLNIDPSERITVRKFRDA